MRKLIALAAMLAAVALPAAADHNGYPDGFDTKDCRLPAGTPVPGSGAVRNVPADYATIQLAVDAANPGDTILIAPGTYHEQVEVTTDALRIRGTSRSGVVLDGQNIRESAFYVTSDYVVIENMTGRNYTDTAFWWRDQIGYWGRYLTGYNNGRYAIYAFGSRCGQFDHSYGSGNADSAFYIGQCFPCDAVIHDIVAEENALGYSGTNAGGNLMLRDSIWRNNALGIVPNSLDGEARPPQRGIMIFRNQVIDNNHKTAPGIGLAGQFYGGGIVIAGGVGNQVVGNTVLGHELGGITLAPLPDQNPWISSGNTIWANTVEGPGPDLAQGATSGFGNCWADNQHADSEPAAIEDVYSCSLPTTPAGGSPVVEQSLVLGAAGMNGRAPGDWRTWPAPTAPEAFVQQADDNGNADFSDDGGVDVWLPALGLN